MKITKIKPGKYKIDYRFDTGMHYVCINPFEEDNCMQYAYINTINVYINGVNVYINTQRKGKETKKRQ